jgi:hypothetical protein
MMGCVVSVRRRSRMLPLASSFLARIRLLVRMVPLLRDGAGLFVNTRFVPQVESDVSPHLPNCVSYLVTVL